MGTSALVTRRPLGRTARAGPNLPHHIDTRLGRHPGHLLLSPSGDDSNAGTITAPFKTLQHARDVVRTVNSDMTGDIDVYLRGGNYPVSRSRS